MKRMLAVKDYRGKKMGLLAEEIDESVEKYVLSFGFTSEDVASHPPIAGQSEGFARGDTTLGALFCGVFLSLVVFVLPVHADGSSLRSPVGERQSPFRSMLRTTSYLVDEESERAFWRMVDAHPGAFDEIVFFTQVTHSPRPIVEHRANAERVSAQLRKAESRGIIAGINVLVTLGHLNEELTPEVARLPMMRKLDGAEVAGRLCPLAVENQSYLRELYAIYARCAPKFIYIDDDVFTQPCFCERCLKRFGADNPGLIAADDTGKAIVNAFEKGDVASRRRMREAWIRFVKVRNDEVVKVAADGVHSVDPSIGIGVMTCSTGPNGFGDAATVRLLRGGNDGVEVRWRPGGGVWSDFSIRELCQKACKMSMQLSFLPADVTCIQSEIENFPYVSLNKSPSFMAFEALLYEAVGCTGVAWNFAGVSIANEDEFRPFFGAAAAMRSAGERVSAAFGRAPCLGVAYPWDTLSPAGNGGERWGGGVNVPIPFELAQVGLPIANDVSRASVLILDGAAASRLSPDALKAVLSKGVLMDGGALSVIQARGMGSLVGFRIVGDAPRDDVSRDLVHPLNLRGGGLRDLRTAFGFKSRHKLLEKTDPSAEYVAESVSLLGRSSGFVSGVYENSLGGRVAVETMAPLHSCGGLSQATHLKRLVRWLSRARIGGWLNSHHRAMLCDRGGRFFVANLATEPLRNGELAVLGAGRFKAVSMESGVLTGETTLEPTRSDGLYSFYRLPDLPVLGELLMVPEEEKAGVEK